MAHTLSKHFGRFVIEEQAVSVTEYAIMLCLIVLVSLSAMTAMGEKIQEIFQSVAQVG